MKKFTRIALTSIIFIASASVESQALAKTEGSYLGFNVLGTKSSHKYGKSGIASSAYPEFSDSALGFGLDYKYAFNFNNFFLAPNIFVEHLGTEAVDRDQDTVSINNRYGAKLDFGYDIADSVALYLSAGVANTSYDVDWKSINQKKSSRDAGFVAGLGILFHPSKDVSINLEYNTQKLIVSTPDFGGINEAETRIDVAKVGVAYHF